MKKIILLIIIGITAIFQANAHVELLTPQGGESYNPGDTINIQWQILVSHNTLDWDLFFSNDGGSSWDTLQINIPPGTLNYQWVVPENATNLAQIRIVQDNVNTDYDDFSGDFTISTITGIPKLLNPQINIYPNPLNNFTTINFTNNPNEIYHLKVYDNNGRVVRTENDINSNKFIFYRESLKEGIYIIQLIENNVIIASSKVVIN